MFSSEQHNRNEPAPATTTRPPGRPSIHAARRIKIIIIFSNEKKSPVYPRIFVYVSCVSNTNNRGREADDATYNKSYIQNQSSSHFRNQIWLDSAIVCSTQSVKGPCGPIVPRLQNDCSIGRATVASSALFAQTHTCTHHHNCAQHTILPYPVVSAYTKY